MRNYLVLYNPGMCGTWLTWLVNQHNNFPQYELTPKEYTNDLGETKALDFGCLDADWYTYKHLSKDSFYLKRKTKDFEESGENVENFLTWSFEENRRRLGIRPIGENNNKSFTKDCVKILSNHGCFHDSLRQDNFDIINQKLLKNIVDEMQPAKIIVPVFNSENDTLIKRWIIYLDWHQKLRTSIFDELVYWKKNWNEWSDYVIQDNPYGNNVHYVDIEKLTSGDNDEYLKLCEALDEQPIPNIQEEIASYRDILSNVASHFDRISQKTVDI